MAHVKLVAIFCAFGVTTVLNYSAYSAVLRRQNAYSTALQDYFDCESTGVSPNNRACDRSIFESLDPTEFTFPVTSVSYILVPLATLLYVTNVKKLVKSKHRKRQDPAQNSANSSNA